MLAKEGGRSWDSLSYELAEQLRASASLSEEEATWAIDSWGLALGKHPQAVALASAAPPPLSPDQDPTIRNEDNLKLKAFTPIVALGGAAGSGLGALLLGIVIFLMMSAGADLTAKFKKTDPRMKEAAAAAEVASFMVVLLLVGSAVVSGGLGGGLGWFVGRGTSKPWVGFWSTFSAGLIATAIATRLCPCFSTVFVAFIATFGAALSSAYGMGNR